MACFALRTVTPGDRERLLEVFYGLSAASRYHRFLAERVAISDDELRRLTHVDHHDHEAILATLAGRGVGVARYVRDAADPARAELAVAVINAYQDLGLGTLLLRRLAERALQEGIGTFHFVYAVSNGRVLGLVSRIGEVHTLGYVGGNVLRAEVGLARPG